MSASALGSPVRGMEEALLGGLRECHLCPYRQQIVNGTAVILFLLQVVELSHAL